MIADCFVGMGMHARLAKPLIATKTLPYALIAILETENVF